ncbi:MAG TPA: MarR family transcriptional regulator [Solirubrobacteraceae bacterium]|jgi:DNA-binding MarR family transcriptional regulator|nr:MarR family transcriptional regulator [Solirubrobacteraceae bacterium]
MTAAGPRAPADDAMRAASVELGRAFKGCVGAVRRLRGRETRCSPGELSDAQYGLLFGLRDHDALPMSELALLADLSPATATEMLDGLAASGLVSRVRSQRDRRVVLTSLTDRGRALVAEHHARFASRWETALAQFSNDELGIASAVLDRLHAMFDEIRPGAEPDPPAPPRRT